MNSQLISSVRVFRGVKVGPGCGIKFQACKRHDPSERVEALDHGESRSEPHLLVVNRDIDVEFVAISFVVSGRSVQIKMDK